MKIAMVKQECNDGDKATITGTVKWVDTVKTHEGQDGTFKTQTLLLVDGERTGDKRNSIFCGFYADKGSWNHLKDGNITVQGTINIYKNEASLRGCKVIESPQNAPQGPSQPAGGQKSTQEYQRPKTPEEAAKIGRMWAITQALANIHNRVLAGDKTAANDDEYLIATRYKYFADTGQKLKVDDQGHSNYPGSDNPNYCGEGGTGESPPEDDIPF